MELGFLAIAIDLLLPPRISIGTSSWSKLSSLYRLFSQQASQAASESAMYSALVDNNAMETCFLELQVMALFPARKMYPDIDLQLSVFLYKVSMYL